MLKGFLISYGILFAYFVYLMVTLSPDYKMGEKEETIANYLGIIIASITMGFFILYIITES